MRGSLALAGWVGSLESGKEPKPPEHTLCVGARAETEWGWGWVLLRRHFPCFHRSHFGPFLMAAKTGA